MTLCRAVAITFCGVVLVALSCAPGHRNRIVVGSKNFTEQLVLGELLAQQIEHTAKLPVERRFYLAGTYICQQAMLAGRIDTYVEYTGTALTAILKQTPSGSHEDVYQRVKDGYARRFGLVVGAPLGFNNTFAILLRGEDARRLNLRNLSQIAGYAPHWRAGFGYEFMERPDGFAGLARTYGLHFQSTRIMDLGLLERALIDKQVDVVAGAATDGLIPVLHLAMVEDDKHYFPPYDAVPVMRSETLEQHPEVGHALAELAGKVSEADIRRLNYAIDGEHREVVSVVREFRKAKHLD